MKGHKNETKTKNPELSVHSGIVFADVWIVGGDNVGVWVNKQKGINYYAT